jgi:hypothetical protein
MVHPLLTPVEVLNRVPAPTPLGLGERAPEPIELANREVFFAESPGDLSLASLDTDTERFESWRRDEGWFHGEPLDQGVVYNNTLRLPGYGVVVEVSHSGYAIGDREQLDDLRVFDVAFTSLEGQILEAAELPGLLYSEVCRSLSRMTRAIESD